MRAVVSRVHSAHCDVSDRTVGAIERGLLVYLGVQAGDDPRQAPTMARKLTRLRVFPDSQDRMNHSVIDIAGGLLLIPNFTLAARATEGTRPSFTEAAEPEHARKCFQDVVEHCRAIVPTATGEFGGHMRIHSVADGPVTLILDLPPD